MNGPAYYLHFGFVMISLANLIVIILLLVFFFLAVTLRLPEKQHLSTLETIPDNGRGATAGGNAVDTEVRS